MKDLMYTEVSMHLIEAGKFQGIDDTTDSIDDASTKQPDKAYIGHRTDNLAYREHT